jgi:hypothetical protein
MAMSNTNTLRFNSRLMAMGTLALVCAILTSCGAKEENLTLLPVSGTVTVDGKTLPMGTVYYQPDESKGNKSTKGISGHIQEDGSYKLITVTSGGNKEGAPVGWYKVTVNVGPPTTEEQKNLKVPTISETYKRPKTTTLLIEVKQGGSYDLKLTSK